jgi:hypothetical protein
MWTPWLDTLLVRTSDDVLNLRDVRCADRNVIQYEPPARRPEPDTRDRDN